jgi:hypothetical protein
VGFVVCGTVYLAYPDLREPIKGSLDGGLLGVAVCRLGYLAAFRRARVFAEAGHECAGAIKKALRMEGFWV